MLKSILYCFKLCISINFQVNKNSGHHPMLLKNIFITKFEMIAYWVLEIGRTEQVNSQFHFYLFPNLVGHFMLF